MVTLYFSIFNLHFHNLPLFQSLPFIIYHVSNELNLSYTQFPKCLVTILLFSAEEVFVKQSEIPKHASSKCLAPSEMFPELLSRLILKNRV